MNKIIKRAVIDAILTTLYIILVALFMFYLQSNALKEKDIVLIPIAMLLLFVFSAGLTGFLVFGKPIMLYLDRKKKDAVFLAVWTLGILFIITLIVFLALLFYYRLI